MVQVMEVDGTPGDTIALTSSDTAQSFSAAVLSVAGRTAQGAILTVEDSPVRIAFGSTPTTSLGHKLDVGAFVRVAGDELMEDLKYISASTGVHGTLMVTPLY